MLTLDISSVNELNTQNNEWRIVRTPFRDHGNKRASFLISRAALGHPLYDYIRFRTFGLCVEEILNNGVEGEAAEAGVFRGNFASIINELLPDRTLYLYDTFDGFDERDIEKEELADSVKNKSWYSHINKTSRSVDLMDEVRSKLLFPEKAVFRAGYFPDSANRDTNVQFCFVSIDMDIYKPTLAALDFFLPRMARNGYIFIHDGKFEGVQRALSEFRRKYGMLPLVPICDPAESYILCKS